MALTTTGTVLALSGITLRDFSARQLTLSTQPIDPGELAYDVNGTLHDLTMDQFRKLQFTITCEDMNAPELEDVWKGKLVTLTVLPSTAFDIGSDDEPPSFDCMLLNWTTNENEWGARVGWTIVLLQR